MCIALILKALLDAQVGLHDPQARLAEKQRVTFIHSGPDCTSPNVVRRSVRVLQAPPPPVSDVPRACVPCLHREIHYLVQLTPQLGMGVVRIVIVRRKLVYRYFGSDKKNCSVK